jgi:hypothetical protein
MGAKAEGLEDSEMERDFSVDTFSPTLQHAINLILCVEERVYENGRAELLLQ